VNDLEAAASRILAWPIERRHAKATGALAERRFAYFLNALNSQLSITGFREWSGRFTLAISIGPEDWTICALFYAGSWVMRLRALRHPPGNDYICTDLDHHPVHAEWLKSDSRGLGHARRAASDEDIAIPSLHAKTRHDLAQPASTAFEQVGLQK
jgi:hypothetical protein